MILFKYIHLLAALVWVGGMFFVYVVLRPAAVATLEPPKRLVLWAGVLRIFFKWVWVAMSVILITGFYLIYLRGGIAQMPRYIHAMLALGLTMMVVFGYMFFACYVPFSLNSAKQRWRDAGEQLNKIRKFVAVNLALGLLVMLVVAVGVTKG